MGQYCDVLGIRSFPKLQDRDADYSEDLFRKFSNYCGVPVISLESATRHPLQSLADLITIHEHWQETSKPKEIGRASCRERVCQYVKIWVVDVALKKKKKKKD